jgi:hypothetical protein
VQSRWRVPEATVFPEDLPDPSGVRRRLWLSLL